MDIKTQREVDFHNALYNSDPIRNEYIYKDRVNARNHKTIKIILGVVVSAIPVVGSLLQVVAKLLV